MVSGLILGMSALALSVLSTVPSSAQRYGPNVERGLVYGTAETFDGRIDTLRLDLFKPVGGGPRRPLIVWVHGGGFSSGRRTDMDLAAEAFARNGYVCASISYRLGFQRPPGLDYPFSKDTTEVIRATFRAVQDLYGAMRFLAGRADADSIDVDRCIVGGASAGAITALHAAFTDEDERPAVTLPLGPGQGTLNTEYPLPKIIAVVSLLGAIDDTTWIDADERIAVYQYHQQGDPIVGCGRARGLHGMPFGIGDNYPVLFGSCAIEEHLQRQRGAATDRRTWIVQGTDHDLHDMSAVFADVRTFLAGLSTSSFVEPQHGTDDLLVVSPNPANSSISIRHAQTMHRVRISDATGKVVFDHAVNAPDVQISVASFPHGLYTVIVDGIRRLVMIGH